jgi:hypothetical protein
MSFSPADEGKPVLDSSGRELAVVADVTDGTAFVDPLDDLANSTRAQLGWGGDDREVYGLDSALVDRVTNSDVHLVEL